MFKLFRIIAIAAVIGFSVVSCGMEATSGNINNKNNNNNSNSDGGEPLRIPVEAPFVVTDEITWAAVADAVKIAGDDKSYIINITKDFELAGLSLTANTFEPSNITVTINGKNSDGNSDEYRAISLKADTQGRLFRIGSKQTVVIDNIGLIGHSNNNSELVYVSGAAAGNVNNDNAVFTMKGKSSVNNNKSANGAAGVKITNGAVFNMLESASINGNAAGADLGAGGGVAVTISGTFNMKDDAVIYNNSAGIGGGVYLNASGGFSCFFNMYDNSKISGNTSNKSILEFEYGGGGVFVAHNCAFRIIGGTVYGNGSDVSPDNLKNQVTGVGATGAAIRLYGTTGTAEYGIYNSTGTWKSNGSLTTTDDTIKVLNGVVQ